VKEASRFVAWLGRVRARHPRVDTAVTIQERFGNARGANLAAAISMRGFLALFPVLVLAIAVVGFIGGDPKTIANDIVDALGLSGSAARTITDAVETAQRTKVASSIIGIVGLLWTGTGLAASLTAAWNQTWHIPGGDVRGRVFGFVWLLGGLVLFGVTLAMLALVGGSGVLPELGVVGGFLVDILVFLWTAWILPTRRIPLRAIVPAAAFGAVCVEVLKIVGTYVIPAIVTRSSALYGTIGAVFALLVWFLLFGRVVVYVTLIEHESWTRRQARLTAPAAR
jgi:membrane protein